MTEPASGGGLGNWWRRLGRPGRIAVIVVAVIIVVAIIGALIPSQDEQASLPNTVTEAVAEPADTEPAPTETQEPAEVVRGKVRGRFARDCFGCGDLKEFIRASDVWCGWRGDTLLVHVRMTNDSIEHVTVNWHPSYTFVGGGEHGAGLTSIQDDGFDAGETRALVAEQHPEGVPPGSRIDECKPSFFLIESG